MKNKLIALGALSLVATAPAMAQDEWSVTTSFTYETAYMFRGMKLADHSFFPSVDVANGPFYAGVWAAFPVDSDATPNEVDVYAGYGFELSEVMSLDVGVTYYTYPSDSEKLLDDDNTLEFYTGLAFDVPYSPAIYVYYDIDAEVLTFEGSAGHSIEMAENLTFDMSAAVGYVDPDAGDDYVYGVATLGFGLSINEAASVSLYGSYSIASEDYTFIRGARTEVNDDEVWFGVSVTAGF